MYIFILRNPVQIVHSRFIIFNTKFTIFSTFKNFVIFLILYENKSYRIKFSKIENLKDFPNKQYVQHFGNENLAVYTCDFK